MSHTDGVGGGCSGVASLHIILKPCSSLCALFSYGKINGSVAVAELKPPSPEFFPWWLRADDKLSPPNLAVSQARAQSKKPGLCLMRQKSLKNVQLQLFVRNCNIWQVGKISQSKIRGAALVKAERQTQKGWPMVSSGPAFPEEEKLWIHASWGCLLSQSIAQVLPQKGCRRNSSPDSIQLQKSSHFPQPSPARLGDSGGTEGTGWTCRKAPASPATSDRAIERGRRGCTLCPFPERCLFSPFVYHTSCLLFCLLHTSSPSLIVLPAPHLGLWIFGSPWVILITSDIKKIK